MRAERPVDDLEGFGAIEAMAHLAISTVRAVPMPAVPRGSIADLYWTAIRGIMIYNRRGRLVERSDAVPRLLLP